MTKRRGKKKAKYYLNYIFFLGISLLKKRLKSFVICMSEVEERVWKRKIKV